MLIKEAIDLLEEKLYKATTVESLSGKDITEYDRGIVKGKIEFINDLKLLVSKSK